jgi:hypothetical protein
MPETMQVPAVGKVKRQWVFAGLALSAGIVGYAYWARSRLPAEEAPGEGDAYGGEQWSPDAYAGATEPGGSTVEPVEGAAPLTNADWAQRVTDLLEGAGFERTFAATTIGKYLSGNPLTLSEKLLIQTAIALLGYPPAGALPIVSAPDTPTTTPPATTLARPGGVRKISSARRGGGATLVVGWTQVAGATSYDIYLNGTPRATSHATYRTLGSVTPLRRGTTYRIKVRARAGTKVGPFSAEVRMSTTS